MTDSEYIIDRTRIPLPYSDLNHTRSSFSSVEKKCSICERIRELHEFGVTKRIYGNVIYKYRRGECKECRNKKTRKQRRKEKEEELRKNPGFRF